jgi:DNA-binding transcriptional MocR family regulator
VADVWKPALTGRGPLYEKLAAAIERDARSGVLPAGTRLPPQRDLAYRLGVSVGTVTKAYIEAERRGLLRGHVGRGTYVAGGDLSGTGPIDLSLNIVPGGPAARYFSDAMAAVRRRADFLDSLAYAPLDGAEWQKKAAADWLRNTSGYQADISRLVLTAGVQHGMSLAMNVLTRPGDTVLCEAATFFGMKSLAEHAGLRLHPCALDGEGLKPSALDKAAAETGARVVYTMPTVQNPTARTMSTARRRDIAAIVRRRKLWVVEDDAYALFAPRDAGHPTLAELVPDRVFHLGGISKAMAPGLRVGFLVCPPGPYFEQILKAIRAVLYAPPAWGALIFGQWTLDGTAERIGEAMRREIAVRAALARKILGAPYAAAIGDTPHFWIAVPELEAERIAGRALRAGVSITAPDAPLVPGGRESGIRVCLGSPDSAATLAIGLERLKAAFAPGVTAAEAALV